MVKKVNVKLVSQDGKETIFSSKTLTKLFSKNENYGKPFELSIQEPDKSKSYVKVGFYTVQSKGTAPPPVEDTAPQVDAGEDIDAKEGIIVTLDGSASDNAGGKIIEQFWTGPDGIKLDPVPDDPSKATFTTPVLEFGEAIRGLIFTFSATDNTGHTSTDQSVVNVRHEQEPEPPGPEPGDGGETEEEKNDAPEGFVKKYDSRDHFGGEERTVFDVEGDINKPDSGYIHINASGKPRLHILGDKGNKHAILENLEAGFGRDYTGVCAYDFCMVRKVRMLDATVDNDSTKHGRHQFRDEGPGDANTPDEQVQGGLGNAWHRNEVDQKIEVVHGGASACSKKASLSPTIKTGDWYRTRFTCIHDDSKKTIMQKSEIEYPIGTGFREVLEQDCNGAPDQFYNKAEFLAWSEMWNRNNGKGRIEYAYRKVYVPK